jgi:anti-sigma factor RsiW
MSHPNVEAQIDAQLDGELPAADAAALATHIAGCASCARFREQRIALRAAISHQVPVFEASPALAARVRNAVREASGSRPARPLDAMSGWRALALAASFAIVAAGAWRLGATYGARESMADGIIASHVRSLMPGHLTDVLSTDQHTVKPWFNGKIDFSPPVADFAGRGYPLLGGRLDYAAGRPVAALVYGRRQHVINVFLWPAGEAARGVVESDSRGYNSINWTTPRFTYWVVSDLGLPELREFAALLQTGDSATAAAPQ